MPLSGVFFNTSYESDRYVSASRCCEIETLHKSFYPVKIPYLPRTNKPFMSYLPYLPPISITSQIIVDAIAGVIICHRSHTGCLKSEPILECNLPSPTVDPFPNLYNHALLPSYHLYK